MLRNIEPHNFSATVSQDYHNVEQSKRGRHGDEHIDGSDADCFVAQKATPTSVKAFRLAAPCTLRP
jgi:hypothetical protein